MKQKRQRTVRIVAIVLAILLAGSAVVTAILSLAYGEEAEPSRNHMTLEMEYLEEARALRITQRLVYRNTSAYALDRLLFYMPANLFRRRDSLPYTGEELPAALPDAYLPGGVELTSVQVNGETADWGYQGEDELCLRVSCALEPGEQCSFAWEYYLLLTENAAFLGVSDDGWRLSGFCFAPATVDANGEFRLNPPLSFTDYIDSPPMDVEADIVLPERYLLAASGGEQCTGMEAQRNRWTISARNVRDFALSFGKRWRETTRSCEGGTELRCLTRLRGAAKRVLDVAEAAVADCERWFGPFPCDQLDFVQTEIGTGPLSHAGCLWLDADTLRDGDARDHAVRCFVAQQYFGESCTARPVSDAWLNDALSEYLGYLLLEEEEGHDAYLEALNGQVVDALQLTIPGGLYISSDASLFTAQEYDIVVRDRGAALFHELRHAMGRDALLVGLRLYYERGLQVDELSEMDLVDALDAGSGRSWEAFLTDWLFHIDEYVNQTIDWLD